MIHSMDIVILVVVITPMNTLEAKVKDGVQNYNSVTFQSRKIHSYVLCSKLI